MAERVFAGKLQRAGFTDIWVGGHQPFGIDQATLYPLFTPEVIQVMRQTIPTDRQDHVATGVIVKARNLRSLRVYRCQARRLRRAQGRPAGVGRVTRRGPGKRLAQSEAGAVAASRT
jgi:hypothetical protein